MIEKAKSAVNVSPREKSKSEFKFNPIASSYIFALSTLTEALSKRDEHAEIRQASFTTQGNIKEYIKIRENGFQKEENEALEGVRLSILLLRDEIEKTPRGRKLPKWIRIEPTKTDSNNQDLYFLPHEGRLVFAKKEKPDLTTAIDAPLVSWFDIGNLPTDLLRALPRRKRNQILKESKRQKPQSKT